MVRPTDWQLLAEKGESSEGWEYHGLDEYRGAACYILGLKREEERKSSIHSVYVGHTNHLNVRTKDHGYWDSTTAKHISKCTQNGFQVYVRYFKAASKAEAKEKEEHLREKGWWKYPWNKRGMPY